MGATLSINGGLDNSLSKLLLIRSDKNFKKLFADDGKKMGKWDTMHDLKKSLQDNGIVMVRLNRSTLLRLDAMEGISASGKAILSSKILNKADPEFRAILENINVTRSGRKNHEAAVAALHQQKNNKALGRQAIGANASVSALGAHLLTLFYYYVEKETDFRKRLREFISSYRSS